MRAIVGEPEETRCLGRFGSRRLRSGKRILLDSELDGGLSSSNLIHIRIAKDQDRKGAKGHLHYRDNERRRPAKRDPLICEDLRGCAEGLWQAFGKGSGSARPNSDRPRPRPGNSGEREPGFTPPRVETHPFSKSHPNKHQNPSAHPRGNFITASVKRDALLPTTLGSARFGLALARHCQP